MSMSGPDATAVRDATASELALRRFLEDLPPVDDADTEVRVARALAAIPDDPTVQEVDAAIGLVDLTSLEGTDTPRKVAALAERAMRPDPSDPSVPPVAAVCVYPDLIGVVARVLGGTEVRAASVAGAFPSGRTSLRVKLAEVREAVHAGADEIDMVLDRGAFLDGAYGKALHDVQAIREACGDAHLKVILETGELRTLDAAHRAAWLALLGGAEFVKTSTGKTSPSATPAAVLALLQAAMAYGEASGREVGVKASGGIRATEDALAYFALVRDSAGPAWLAPQRFRFGASSLLDDLVARRAGASRVMGGSERS
jgi:deoxyribose-phosphate aldolase